MNEVLVIVGMAVVTIGVMAAAVWMMGRLEAREERRAAEQAPGVGDRAPRHMRGRRGPGRPRRAASVPPYLP